MPEDEPPFVGFDGRDGEVGDVLVGDGALLFDALSEFAQPGAQDDADARLQRRRPLDDSTASCMCWRSNETGAVWLMAEDRLVEQALLLRGRSPKIAVPMRRRVAPSSTATSKSALMPIERWGKSAAVAP
jgi:hypothetical protein